MTPSFASQLNAAIDDEIIYPESDGLPMTESDITRDYLIYGVEALSLHFQAQSHVYVSGNLFIYYKKGIPDAVVSPDVFVVFGVAKKKRKVYKVWDEGDRVPAFVLEITSKTTRGNDEEDKYQKYQKLGVLEYFQYDPTGDYLEPQLKGSRLVNDRYQSIDPTSLPSGGISLHSTTLDLDLHLIDKALRFYNPKTQETLLTPSEQDQARRQAEQAQKQAEQALAQETLVRQQAEQAQRQAIPRLLELGLSEEQIATALSLSIEQVRFMLL